VADVRECLQEVHSAGVLQDITSINPKTYYELLNAKVITAEMPYQVAIQRLMKYYQKTEGVARERLALQRQEQEAKRKKAEDPDGGMPAVLRAEKIQKIRVDMAREQELWLKNAQTRKEVCDMEELYGMLEPFILSQKGALTQAALTEPALQPVVSKCLNDLYALGERIAFLAEKDAAAFVTTMCEREVDLDAINASMTLKGMTDE
jgi:hypothetical protein